MGCRSGVGAGEGLAESLFFSSSEATGKEQGESGVRETQVGRGWDVGVGAKRKGKRKKEGRRKRERQKEK